jgi:hypothetical protein
MSRVSCIDCDKPLSPDLKPAFDESRPERHRVSSSKPVLRSLARHLSKTRHLGSMCLYEAVGRLCGSETATSPAAEARSAACLAGFLGTSADAPSTRRPFKNRRRRLRLPIVPHRSGNPDCLFAGLALLSGAIADRIRSTQR